MNISRICLIICACITLLGAFLTYFNIWPSIRYILFGVVYLLSIMTLVISIHRKENFTSGLVLVVTFTSLLIIGILSQTLHWNTNLYP